MPNKAVLIHSRFVKVVDALSGTKGIQLGTGKGFGVNSLKVNGRIFAMISSRGEFVIKLPGARVDELVRSGRGKYFDAGRGRKMKEWFVGTKAVDWVGLAEEAYCFVKQGKNNEAFFHQARP